MPPKGESIGFALEDVVILSRLLEKYQSSQPIEIFERFDNIRRSRIEKAFDDSNWGWETNKDKGWLFGIIMEWMTGLYLWWKKDSMEEDLVFDVRDIPL
jgi:hypothetical protein